MMRPEPVGSIVLAPAIVDHLVISVAAGIRSASCATAAIHTLRRTERSVAAVREM